MRLPLTQTDKRKPPDVSDLSLRLHIDGSKAQVHVRDGQEWIEATFSHCAMTTRFSSNGHVR